MSDFRFSPTSRGERRKAHSYKASMAHSHNVPSKRNPGMQVAARCTRLDCFAILSPNGRVRFGSAREYGR